MSAISPSLVCFSVSLLCVLCSAEVPATNQGYNATACEDTHLLLACPSGTTIEVTSANYGRTDRTQCPNERYSKNTSCYTPHTLSYVASRCNHKESCVVTASNEVFGDPCPHIYKYLQVTHNCKAIKEDILGYKPPTEHMALACEGSSATLKCPAEHKLTILSANYGRTDKTLCSKFFSISTTNCQTLNSQQVVAQKCEGNNNCSVGATNAVFGDPCRGVLKYLSVHYMCSNNQTISDLIYPPTAPTPGEFAEIHPTPMGERSTACEGNIVELMCSNNSVISVVSAVYGRTDASICPEKPIYTTSCLAKASLSVVSFRCNERQRCVVKSSNTNFGDPCIGTTKYLDVIYNCLRDSYTRVACEHDVMSLSCPVGQVINLRFAGYGRMDDKFCPGIMKTINCVAQNSLDVLSEKCNNRTNCNILASNSQFGDPCIGTYKYLEVVYDCVNETEEFLPTLPSPSAISSKDTQEGTDIIQNGTACENEPLFISCQEGHSIRIISANYGRTDIHTCPGKSGTITTCLSPNTFPVVSSRCDGKKECNVLASNFVFGDPCVGTYKYLQIQYKCDKSKLLQLDNF